MPVARDGIQPIRRVLVPMDGSPLSERALEIALTEYPDATVTVLHVVGPTVPGYSYPVDADPATEPLHGSSEWYPRSEELAATPFEDARTVADRLDRTVETETRVGEAGRAIVEYAADEGVDQIVVGSHGRDDPAAGLLGSATETVVFRSPVRVLLVR